MLFALQNMAQVELTILVWTFEARRIIVISLSFLIGLVLGMIIRGIPARQTKKLEESAAAKNRWQ